MKKNAADVFVLYFAVKGVMQGVEEEHCAMLLRVVFAETPKLPLRPELKELL